MTRLVTCIAAGVIALGAAGCEFHPTAPFSGFDDQGSRIVGQFESGGAGVSTLAAQSGASASTVSVGGIVVMVQERPSLTTTVDQNGRFTLSGVPPGSFTLVFLLDGKTIGEIRFRNVRENQGIRISVVLTLSIEVVLINEQRDAVSFSGECPRGTGFWCQNQRGQNPNLSSAEFDKFAEKAAELLKDLPALDTPAEVAAAVCNTGNQFVRQLAALALNLAAETVQLDTNLEGEPAPYVTVGDAFEAAVAHLTGAGPLNAAAQQTLKDVMDRINNAQNVESCDQLPDDDDSDDDQPTSGQMTICHVPPGNYNARHTITIDASAWPSHQGHCAQGVCDYTGSCH
jgi:hypothetical protein